MHFTQNKCWHESLMKFEPNCYRIKISYRRTNLCKCNSVSQDNAWIVHVQWPAQLVEGEEVRLEHSSLSSLRCEF
uniref:Uncharacterized protein n=1 Tax=Arundo donax TaxID=35708 RepID=A0A0A9FLH3_ARUDO